MKTLHHCFTLFFEAIPYRLFMFNQISIFYINRRNKNSMSTHNQFPNTSHRSNNKTVLKCEQQRSNFIHRELSQLIKNQVKVFFQTKKLGKQLEDQHKDYVIMDVPSPIERVKQFRQKQRDRSLKMLAQLQEKNQKSEEKQLKYKNNLKIKNIVKAKENLSRIKAANSKRQSLEKQEIQKLSKIYSGWNCNSSVSVRSSRCPTPISEDKKIQQTIHKVEQSNKRIEAEKIDRYMKKMKGAEQKSLKKDLIRWTKKQNCPKKIKCYIPKRNQLQESQVNQWKERYEHSFSKFDKKRHSILRQRNDSFLKSSKNRSMMHTSALEKRIQIKQNLINYRETLLQDKLSRIDKIPKRKNNDLSKSYQNFSHNLQTFYNDSQKQDHNRLMHTIHDILNRIKGLGNQEKLPEKEMKLLLQNMEKNHPLYGQMQAYLKSTKDQFFQRKQKEEEQRLKKQKKANQKVL